MLKTVHYQPKPESNPSLGLLTLITALEAWSNIPVHVCTPLPGLEAWQGFSPCTAGDRTHRALLFLKYMGQEPTSQVHMALY